MHTFQVQADKDGGSHRLYVPRGNIKTKKDYRQSITQSLRGGSKTFLAPPLSQFRKYDKIQT